MIKQDVYDEVQGLEPLCQEICHTLWNHPELSGNESTKFDRWDSFDSKI